jgi:cell division topological specificity factor
MSLISYFKRKKSAGVAKDRLQIIIAQQRTGNNDTPDFLPLLRQDIINAIAKYTKIDVDALQVDLQCKDNNSILELNVVLPDKIAS